MQQSPLVLKAEAFAREAHKDHTRNDVAKTPYVHHLEEVAGLVGQSGGTDNEIAAAWLHDAVEDTAVTIEDVKNSFGEEIAEIVYGLTDLPEFLAFSLADRKAKQAERVKNESESVRRVKLADQTSNVKIVGERRDNFSLADKHDYIEGARAIAQACSGISDFLDKEFGERYLVAKKNLEAK